jgi:hypothetical protein
MLRQVWAGVDIGKGHHHAVVIDGNGDRLLSRRVANDETALLALQQIISPTESGRGEAGHPCSWSPRPGSNRRPAAYKAAALAS